MLQDCDALWVIYCCTGVSGCTSSFEEWSQLHDLPIPAVGGGKDGESVEQQRETGRDWWNVKFSSAEETGLALLPVIGLAPFPKSKPTTLYCHFLFFSLSLLLALTHIHQFPIQSTQSPAVPSLAPSRSSMLVELSFSLSLCILVKQIQWLLQHWLL